MLGEDKPFFFWQNKKEHFLNISFDKKQGANKQEQANPPPFFLNPPQTSTTYTYNIHNSNSNDSNTQKNNSIEDKKIQIQEEIQNIKTLLEKHQDDLSPDELKKLEKQLQELQKQDLENNNLDSSKNQIPNTPSPFNGNKKDGE